MKMTTICWEYALWGRMWESMFSKLYLWKIKLEWVEKSNLEQTNKILAENFLKEELWQNKILKKYGKQSFLIRNAEYFYPWGNLPLGLLKQIIDSKKPTGGGNRGSRERRKEPNGWIREGRSTENINMYCTTSSWKMCQQIPGQLQLASNWPSSFG